MMVKVHPHAKARIKERGATEEEVIATVKYGKRFVVKFGSQAFDAIFPIIACGEENTMPTNRLRQSPSERVRLGL